MANFCERRITQTQNHRALGLHYLIEPLLANSWCVVSRFSFKTDKLGIRLANIFEYTTFLQYVVIQRSQLSQSTDRIEFTYGHCDSMLLKKDNTKEELQNYVLKEKKMVRLSGDATMQIEVNSVVVFTLKGLSRPQVLD